MSTATISGYHAHLYYSLDQLELAQRIAQKASDQFNIQVGRFHEKPIGPHPVPSCQLAFSNDQFEKIIQTRFLVIITRTIKKFSQSAKCDNIVPI